MNQPHTFTISDGRKISFEGNEYRFFQDSINFDMQEISEIPLNCQPPFLRTLALTITNNCNMGCVYCYGNQGHWDKPHYNMSIDTAKKSVDLLFENIRISDGNSATITFFGGEPLLRFDFIKKITSYAKERASNDITIRFATITNGTHIKQEQIDFFKKEKFVLSLSLDGTKQQHNSSRIYKNGDGTYSDIIKNYADIEKYIPILIRATISDHNYDVCSAIQHIHSLGFTRIMYELDFDISKDNYTNFLHSTENLYRYYLDQIKKGNFFDLRNFTRVIASILTKRRSKSHCDAGIGYMSISADGLLYPCHRFIGIKNTVTGNISQLSSHDIIKSATEFDNLLGKHPGKRNDECIDCSFAFLCGGSCIYHSYLKHKNMLVISKNDCLFKRTTFDQVLRLMSELKGNNLSHFIKFLIEVWHTENGFIS